MATGTGLRCISSTSRGVIRHVRIGEGGYQETERLIQSLLAETF
jgi:hypothetical protein